MAELEREKLRLEQRLKKAETIIEIPQNAPELMGIPLSGSSSSEEHE